MTSNLPFIFPLPVCHLLTSILLLGRQGGHPLPTYPIPSHTPWGLNPFPSADHPIPCRVWFLPTTSLTSPVDWLIGGHPPSHMQHFLPWFPPGHLGSSLCLPMPKLCLWFQFPMPILLYTHGYHCLTLLLPQTGGGRFVFSFELYLPRERTLDLTQFPVPSMRHTGTAFPCLPCPQLQFPEFLDSRLLQVAVGAWTGGGIELLHCYTTVQTALLNLPQCHVLWLFSGGRRGGEALPATISALTWFPLPPTTTTYHLFHPPWFLPT